MTNATSIVFWQEGKKDNFFSFSKERSCLLPEEWRPQCLSFHIAQRLHRWNRTFSMARMKEYTKWHLWTEKVNNLHIFTCQSFFFQWHITMDTSKDHIKMVINISDKNSQLLATPWRLLSHLDTWKWMLKGVRVSKAPRYLLLPGLLYGYILVDLPVEPKGRFGWVKNEGWRCYKPEVCLLPGLRTWIGC